ncbi:MAG: hypothetical protein WA874_21220 [Chryseosolibacter sp.]
MNRQVLTIIAIITASFATMRCSDKQRSESAPILVIASQENFGLYTAEILRTEGFNAFRLDSLRDKKITPDYLQGFDIVILTATQVEDHERALLQDFVRNGGNLIAFRPDKKLAELFGMKDTSGSLSEAYIAIDNKTEIGNGLRRETLQFHGDADKYALSTGQAIASLYTDAETSAEMPAVVMNAYGNGRAVAFLYNLPESIVLTRQGNYRHAGQEMDGITGVRAMDLFTGGWVDPTKNILNQADEQMRLLSHCIESLSAGKRPLPRFWYFPDTLQCVVTLNNDGEDSKEREFVKQFEDVNAKRAKMTLYIKEVEFVSKEWVHNWQNKGFEISGHPDDTKQAVNPDWNTMDSVYRSLLSELKTDYGIPSMETVTNHWFVWVGKNQDGSPNFAAQARIEEMHGVGLDCNYAHYDNGSSHGHFLGEFGTNQGNYTGSGLAMKFADANGEVINVYQQLNNVYDQQYMEHKDQDGYYNAFKGIMDRSLDDEVYSSISVRAHNNEYFFSEIPLMKMLDYANDKGIPVWTELQLLEFLKTKDEASFTNITWSDKVLSFEIKSALKYDRGITCLIPASFDGAEINKVTVDGEERAFVIRPMKGNDYAWVTVKPGVSYRIVVGYQ